MLALGILSLSVSLFLFWVSIQGGKFMQGDYSTAMHQLGTNVKTWLASGSTATPNAANIETV